MSRGGSVLLPKKALKSWGRLLEEVLRTSPGRRLEDVSLKISWGRLLEDVSRKSPGLKKKVVATSISDQYKTSLRPKLRLFYDVSAMSLCRLRKNGINYLKLLYLQTAGITSLLIYAILLCLVQKHSNNSLRLNLMKIYVGS